jgi:hypothetical protein
MAIRIEAYEQLADVMGNRCPVQGGVIGDVQYPPRRKDLLPKAVNIPPEDAEDEANARNEALLQAKGQMDEENRRQ